MEIKNFLPFCQEDALVPTQQKSVLNLIESGTLPHFTQFELDVDFSRIDLSTHA